jgi:tryptophan synthase alpha chain
MNALSHRFADLRARGEKALVLFVTAGDPPLDQLPAIVDALIEGGADAIEIGIPFSDPFGEGPTIQASSQRALDSGVSARSILGVVANLPKTVPMVTMGYYNPVLRFGLDAFAEASRAAGVSGTIISDLVPDEADAWDAACGSRDLSTIYLVAPTSTPARIAEVCQRSTGFVYVVSRTGVTGAESAVPPEVADLTARVRAQTDRPVCVGFGISKPEHIRMVCEVADGAVIGSALVKLLHETWDNGAGRAHLVETVRAWKSATRGA